MLEKHNVRKRQRLTRNDRHQALTLLMALLSTFKDLLDARVRHEPHDCNKGI